MVSFSVLWVPLSVTWHAVDHLQSNCDILALVEIYYFKSLVIQNSVNLGGRGKALIQCLISLSWRMHMALLVHVCLVSGSYEFLKMRFSHNHSNSSTVD